MRQRDVQMGAGVDRGIVVPLGDPHAVDLGAHHRAIGDAEVAQRSRGGILGAAQVFVEEELAEIWPPEIFEIHGQEGGVVHPVDISKPVVEFEAVEQDRPFGHTEDVLGQQITVAVDDSAPGDARGVESAAAGQEAGGQPGDLGQCSFGQHSAGVAPQFGQVLLPPLRQRSHAGLGVDRLATLGGGVKTR